MSFSHRIRQCFCSIPQFDLCHVHSSSTNNFAHAQTLSRMSSLSGRMNIAWVNIGFFTGFKKNKTATYFLQFLYQLTLVVSNFRLSRIFIEVLNLVVYKLGMSNRLKPYNRLLGQVSDRVPGYSVENLLCSV